MFTAFGKELFCCHVCGTHNLVASNIDQIISGEEASELYPVERTISEITSIADLRHLFASSPQSEILCYSHTLSSEAINLTSIPTAQLKLAESPEKLRSFDDIEKWTKRERLTGKKFDLIYARISLSESSPLLNQIKVLQDLLAEGGGLFIRMSRIDALYEPDFTLNRLKLRPSCFDSHVASTEGVERFLRDHNLSGFKVSARGLDLILAKSPRVEGEHFPLEPVDVFRRFTRDISNVMLRDQFPTFRSGIFKLYTILVDSGLYQEAAELHLFASSIIDGTIQNGMDQTKSLSGSAHARLAFNVAMLELNHFKNYEIAAKCFAQSADLAGSYSESSGAPDEAMIELAGCSSYHEVVALNSLGAKARASLRIQDLLSQDMHPEWSRRLMSLQGSLNS
ncbi:hypothetical protein [Asticcacaulis sp.]|uniref:hypothetical protein n=1 Tax=Asticcacaulis sp. TaxID=1872648 RepID=UPI00391A8494